MGRSGGEGNRSGKGARGNSEWREGACGMGGRGLGWNTGMGGRAGKEFVVGVGRR